MSADHWENRHWGQVQRQETRKTDALRTADETTARAKNLVKMANETRDIGAETLTVLSQQSDQLRRVEDRVDSIDDHLTFSERTLRGMESVWGSLKNMMTKPTQGRGAGGGAGGAGYRASAVDKTFTGQLAAKEREQDECLDQLSSIVGDLKAMGHDVSSELDKQNMMVDRIGDKVQRNDDRIRSTTKRIQKL